MISNIEINKVVDFEVDWTDSSLHPQDMNNVTFELYHYVPSSPAEILAPIQEPYIITETISDTLGVSALNISGTGTLLTTTIITLELNIIVDQLESLGCPPNDFVVPGTNSKVSIFGGYKVFALSSSELAALINLQASGYFAEDKGGFLVLKTETSGSLTQIALDSGTLNPIIGGIQGNIYFGTDLSVVHDITATPMAHVSLGKYVYPGLKFAEPTYSVDKRYYITYKAIDPSTMLEEDKEEDFIILKSNKTTLTYSFTG